MHNRILNSQIQKLKDLFDRTQEASGYDFEVQSHWARYLCVLSAGFLENALVETFVCFCDSASSDNVSNYARKSLSQIQNPKTKRFIEITTSFNTIWGERLALFVEDNGRKEAVDLIMSNRHRIAHGKNSDISIVRLRQALNKSIEVIEFIETLYGLSSSHTSA